MRSQISASAYGTVVFHARYPSRGLSVLVRARGGHSAYVLAQMESDGADHWRLTLKLPNGNYRYRYYADLDGVVIQVSPTEVEDRAADQHRFDAELVVGAEERRILQKSVNDRGGSAARRALRTASTSMAS